ncbi:MAG: ferritin-like domain-containing protein [Myxococcales bacterium]|jgi:hypothetical protein
MDYEQHNPVPIPKSGAYQSVKSTIEAVFDWQYALEERDLMSLYEKGKRLNWNANELPWDTEVDVGRLSADADVHTFFNDVLKAPRRLDKETAVLFRTHQNAHMLSQFLHGEQGALLATAKIVQVVPWEEAKFYAATQVNDEARHVEVYHRYLTEKLGISYEVHPDLRELLEAIMRDSRWDITYLGMQILVEGLALAAFGTMRLTMSSEPLIQEITTRIMQDEARHVGFGVLSLRKAYEEEMSARELKEREDFIIDATHLLYERLSPAPVLDRLGWDRSVWLEWMENTPFNRGMRQMMFSKIVPNLRRLGLLTPRVRKSYEKLDLLRFQDGKDSVEEPEVTPPQEMVQLLMDHLAKAEPAADTSKA